LEQVMEKSPKPSARRRVSLGAIRNPECEEALLTAATEILEERGYRGFTIQAVVTRAQSSKPTIYRRWRNKCALIMAVYNKMGEKALVLPSPSSLEQELVEYLRSVWQWWATTHAGEVVRSMITEAQLEPDSITNLREVFLPARSRILFIILERAKARGDIPVNFEMRYVVGLLMGTSWMRLLTDDLKNVAEIDELVRVVAGGLRSLARSS
jgi:AcrR family transcriptional regulator